MEIVFHQLQSFRLLETIAVWNNESPRPPRGFRCQDENSFLLISDRYYKQLIFGNEIFKIPKYPYFQYMNREKNFADNNQKKLTIYARYIIMNCIPAHWEPGMQRKIGD